MFGGHSSRLHAKYSASAAYRWMKCYGSVAFLESMPALPSSPESVDGTEAHELLEYCLLFKFWDAWAASKAAMTYERDTAFEAGERLEAVQVALDYIKDILDAYDDAILYVERPFHFPSLVDPENTWGTCDVCIYIPSLKLVYIIDYKHGKGYAVNSEENHQGLYYATGAVLGDDPIDAETICIVIIQPRCYHPLGRVREWVVGQYRLHQFIGEVDAAILACQQPGARRVAGYEQCKFCAKPLCDEYERANVSTAIAGFQTFKDIQPTVWETPQTLDLARLIAIDDHGDAIIKYVKEAREILYNYAMEGHTVPERKLVEAQSKRKWPAGKLDAGTAEQLIHLLGFSEAHTAPTRVWDAVMPRTLIGIGEAEKLIKTHFKLNAIDGNTKKAAEDANKALAQLTVKDTTGNLKLVHVTDKRPAVDRATVAFSGVKIIAQPETN